MNRTNAGSTNSSAAILNQNVKSMLNGTSSNNTPTAASLTVFSNESIKSIAESIGTSNLSDESSRDLASDLAFTLKSMLLDAQKFCRKSRRKKLTTSDIDNALKVRSIEPIYGFYSLDSIPFRCFTSIGGNGAGRSMYYQEDQIVNLDDLIATNNKTCKLPNDFVINAHWLAIDGVQPSIPENPELVSREMQKKEILEGLNATKLKEKQQLLQRRGAPVGDSLVKLKSLVPHDLSMEQQIYFKEITESCVGCDESKRSEALNSLALDPGLHQLLPRIVLFISEGVRLNIAQNNMAILIYLMRMAKSLIENKSIYLEKYLHELLPSIFSCILSKQLCNRPEVDNHWALREFGARLIGQIVKGYSSTISELQTRIIKIYLKSLQSERTTFSTVFGAIVGLAELGNEICESFLFPLIKPLGERVTQILDSTATTQEKMPADKVKQQIIKILSNVLKPKSAHVHHEFDYLTSEFGAYIGSLVHTQLMKVRGHHSHLSHPQFSTTGALSDTSQIIRTTINPINTLQNEVRFQTISHSIQPQLSSMAVSQINVIPKIEPQQVQVPTDSSTYQNSTEEDNSSIALITEIKGNNNLSKLDTSDDEDLEDPFEAIEKNSETVSSKEMDFENGTPQEITDNVD